MAKTTAIIGTSRPALFLFIHFGLMGFIQPSLAALPDAILGWPSLSKAHFCRSYSSCRRQAQQQLGQCSGGVLAALAVKQGIMQQQQNGREEVLNMQKCIFEMNKTIGASMRALYERLERKAMKCAEQNLADPHRALNNEQLLSCKSLYMDYLLNMSTSPLELLTQEQDSQQPVDAMPAHTHECVQQYDARLVQCETINKCCPELDSCLLAIESQSEIRTKEIRVLNLLDKCINEIPLKSSEVLFMKRTTGNGEDGVEEKDEDEQLGDAEEEEEEEGRKEEDGSDGLTEPVPISIGTSAINSPPASADPMNSTYATLSTRKLASENNGTITTPTFSSPEDMHDLLEFLLPGRSQQRKIAAFDKELVDFVLDKMHRRQQQKEEEVATANPPLRKKGLEKVAMEEVEVGQQKKQEEWRKRKQTTTTESSRTTADTENVRKVESQAAAFVTEQANLDADGTTQLSSSSTMSTTTPAPAQAAVTIAKAAAINSFASTALPASAENKQYPSVPASSSTAASIMDYLPSDRLIAMAVGRVFCAQYSECIDARSKLGAACNLPLPPNESSELAAKHWFTFEKMDKCLEAKPLTFLASALTSNVPPQHCSILGEMGTRCRMLRDCCPSIVR